MMMHELLTKIDRFRTETGMSRSRFGRKFMRDPGFIQRLEAGGQCYPSTAQSLVEKMDAAQKPARLLTTGGES